MKHCCINNPVQYERNCGFRHLVHQCWGATIMTECLNITILPRRSDTVVLWTFGWSCIASSTRWRRAMTGLKDSWTTVTPLQSYTPVCGDPGDQYSSKFLWRSWGCIYYCIKYSIWFATNMSASLEWGNNRSAVPQSLLEKLHWSSNKSCFFFLTN